MSLTTRLSPARVSAAAAVAFPRWALFALLTVYIVPGLFGRDPWGGEDAAGFGLMWTMAHGSAADWLLPSLGGEWIAEEGPLHAWVGAALVLLLGGWLGDPLAARLSTVLWFALTITALWYATYRLARREEAQPVSFAFGGEAAPRDYGRMLADIAVLLLLGTVGIALRMHETTAEAVALAASAVALFGLAWSLDRPLPGAAVAGLAIAAAGLSRGPWLAIWLLIGALAALRFTVGAKQRPRAFAALTVLGVGGFALWPLTSLTLAPENNPASFWSAYVEWLATGVSWPTVSHLAWWPRNGAWYMWPLWPLAAWALYAWRHLLATPHVAVPLALGAASLAASLTAEPMTESWAIPMVAPLVLLATFGAASLRRSLDDLIDWFAMATFSLFALAAWLYFASWQRGVPKAMAGSVQRLIPGFTEAPALPVLLLAAAATVLWLVLVAWRIVRRPPMLWSGPLLGAAGLTMLWLLLTTLFLAAVNYNRSYRQLAEQAGAQVALQLGTGTGSCVRAHRLSDGQRALFAYFGGIDFGHPGSPRDCELLLQRDSRRTALDDDLPPGEWRAVWASSWPARPDEVIRLHRLGNR